MTAFDMTTVRVAGEGLRFPEGPLVDGDGSPLVVEIEGGALTRVRRDGSAEVVGNCGGGPNGAAFGPDGAIYVCNDGGLSFRTEDGIRFPFEIAEGNDGGTVQRVDPATGSVDVVFAECDGARIGGLNDIVFDTSGRCYVVDTTNGLLYYADPVAGDIRVAADGLAFPNGAGLAPDGTRLYVSETYSGRVLEWEVTAPGRLDPCRELYTSGGAHGWDGLAVDGAGNVCASNLERSGITVIGATGDVIDAFVTPLHDPYVTNICFDAARGLAYVCSSGRGLLYELRWPWPGLRLNFQP
jgi:gluconolactonase